MLAKKVETLNKAIEKESKKMRRDMRAMEKEFTEISGVNGQDHRAPRRSVNGSRSVHLVILLLRINMFHCFLFMDFMLISRNKFRSTLNYKSCWLFHSIQNE